MITSVVTMLVYTVVCSIAARASDKYRRKKMFPSSVRASVSAIGYTLEYVLFGGTAPFVATGLVAGFGTPLAPAFYLMGVAVISAAVVILFFPETKDLPLLRTTVL